MKTETLGCFIRSKTVGGLPAKQYFGLVGGVVYIRRLILCKDTDVVVPISRIIKRYKGHVLLEDKFAIKAGTLMSAMKYFADNQK
jgi:hypothetical protein